MVSESDSCEERQENRPTRNVAHDDVLVSDLFCFLFFSSKFRV